MALFHLRYTSWKMQQQTWKFKQQKYLINKQFKISWLSSFSSHLCSVTFLLYTYQQQAQNIKQNTDLTLAVFVMNILKSVLYRQL